MQINFYHIKYFEKFKLIPKLISGIFNKSKRNMLVLTEDQKQLTLIDNLLWSFSPLAFPPHATYADPYPEKQAILIDLFTNIIIDKNLSSIDQKDETDKKGDQSSIDTRDNIIANNASILTMLNPIENIEQKNMDILRNLTNLVIILDSEDINNNQKSLRGNFEYYQQNNYSIKYITQNQNYNFIEEELEILLKEINI